jgi:hypothetical protein
LERKVDVLGPPPLGFVSMLEPPREPSDCLAVPSSDDCRGRELITSKCEAELGTE